MEYNSTAQRFVGSDSFVHHVEADLLTPGNIVYIDKHTLKTSDGKSTHLLAGNTKHGNSNGKRGAARFISPHGFIQVSNVTTVMMDTFNNCLRKINRTSGVTSTFSGVCGNKRSYKDG